jgi:hypothetical protein
MPWGWWKRRRRRRWLEAGFPPAWEETLRTNVVWASRLPGDLQVRLREKTVILVREKNWEGCGGLSLTEEMRVTIAAQASLLVLGDAEACFDHVLSILVYPTAFIAPNVRVTQAGVVIEEGEAREGEAWYRGPVILSWDDALDGGRRMHPEHNLVWHEFAHQLDMQNGQSLDGTPPLPEIELARRWAEVMEAEYQQLRRDCRSGRPTLLDCYGTKDRAEFFAVATEAFFGRPAALSYRQPVLYDVLRRCYRLDPRSWSVPGTPD